MRIFIVISNIIIRVALLIIKIATSRKVTICRENHENDPINTRTLFANDAKFNNVQQIK